MFADLNTFELYVTLVEFKTLVECSTKYECKVSVASTHSVQL